MISGRTPCVNAGWVARALLDHVRLHDHCRSAWRRCAVPTHQTPLPMGFRLATGCASGHADVVPITGQNDCPVCNGSG